MCGIMSTGITGIGTSREGSFDSHLRCYPALEMRSPVPEAGLAFVLVIALAGCGSSSPRNAPRGIHESSPDFARLLRRCDADDSIACGWLSDWYVAFENEKAARFARRACELGSGKHCERLGDTYRSSDPALSAAYYRGACARGEWSACGSMRWRRRFITP
jgi:hypothetical protein